MALSQVHCLCSALLLDALPSPTSSSLPVTPTLRFSRVPTALTVIAAEDLKQQARGQACFGFQITSGLWYSFKILSLVLRLYGIFNWINKRDSKESASSQ